MGSFPGWVGNIPLLLLYDGDLTFNTHGMYKNWLQ